MTVSDRPETRYMAVRPAAVVPPGIFLFLMLVFLLRAPDL